MWLQCFVTDAFYVYRNQVKLNVLYRTKKINIVREETSNTWKDKTSVYSDKMDKQCLHTVKKKYL